MGKLIIKERYATVPNSILCTPKISLKAKGLYAYMQSKPDGWNFSAMRIATECSEQRSAIEKAMQELENVGLLTRSKYKNESGQWDWEHQLLAHSPVLSFPALDNPALDNPALDNRAINKTINNKQDIQRNKDISVGGKPPTLSSGKVKKPAKGKYSPHGKKGSMEAILFDKVSNAMLEGKDRGYQVVGAYMAYRRASLLPKIRTSGQLYEFCQRHISAANKLTAWNDEELTKAFAGATTKYPEIDWTLETLLKEFTK